MPSRRELIALTEGEIRDYLNSEKTLIIVSNGKSGYPHPMPMWFCADDDGNLFCTTFAKSQKVLNFRRDPRASLLVESGETYESLKSVLIYATTQIIDDFETVVDVLVKIHTKGQDASLVDVDQVRAAVSKTAQKRVALKFVPEQVISWDHAKLGGRY